jgi:hypothetical protein
MAEHNLALHKKAESATQTATESGDSDDHESAANAHEDAASESFSVGNIDDAKAHAEQAKKHRHARGLKPNPLAAWAKKRSA